MNRHYHLLLSAGLSGNRDGCVDRDRSSVLRRGGDDERRSGPEACQRWGRNGLDLPPVPVDLRFAGANDDLIHAEDRTALRIDQDPGVSAAGARTGEGDTCRRRERRGRCCQLARGPFDRTATSDADEPRRCRPRGYWRENHHETRAANEQNSTPFDPNRVGRQRSGRSSRRRPGGLLWGSSSGAQRARDLRRGSLGTYRREPERRSIGHRADVPGRSFCGAPEDWAGE